ncbi:MAG TPA: hypothetical protein P5309_04015 [Syntrophomonadaceae bacterium]|nr:hypothetical protein [Syntrophomonadaceae bacterium]
MAENPQMETLKKTIDILKKMHQLNNMNPVLAQYEKGFLDALTTIEMSIYTIETQSMVTESMTQFWNMFKIPDYFGKTREGTEGDKKGGPDKV